MKVKTECLIGVALDWAVAVAEGLKPTMRHDYMKAKAEANNYKGDLAWHLEVTPNEPITVDEAGVTHVLRPYSEQWSQGGPIIEREGITTSKEDGGWSSYFRDNLFEDDGSEHWQTGPTPLVAAMRCFVASKLGDEVDIPEELLE